MPLTPTPPRQPPEVDTPPAPHVDRPALPGVDLPEIPEVKRPAPDVVPDQPGPEVQMPPGVRPGPETGEPLPDRPVSPPEPAPSPPHVG